MLTIGINGLCFLWLVTPSEIISIPHVVVTEYDAIQKQPIIMYTVKYLEYQLSGLDTTYFFTFLTRVILKNIVAIVQGVTVIRYSGNFPLLFPADSILFLYAHHNVRHKRNFTISSVKCKKNQILTPQKLYINI